MKLKATNIAIAVMLIIPAALMIYKLGFHGYSFEKTLARTSYQVHLDFQVQAEAEADSMQLQAFLPESDDRQQIRAESNRSDGAEILIMRGDNGRYASWMSTDKRPLHLSYTFEFLGYGLKYDLDSNLKVSDSITAAQAPFLLPPSGRYEHHKVASIASSLNLDEGFVKNILEQSFASSQEVAYDPVTRFIGLVRHAGIPARYVSGIDLGDEADQDRLWAEAQVAGTWIPFDPKGGYFARIPANYLKLNHGADKVSVNSSNTPFTAQVEVRQKAAIDPALLAELPNQPFNAFAVWHAFEIAGIPLDIFKVILCCLWARWWWPCSATWLA